MGRLRSWRRSKSLASVAASTRGLSHRPRTLVIVFLMSAKLLSEPPAKSASAVRQPTERFSPGLASSFLKKTRGRSEEHTSELQTLMRILYAVIRLQTTKIILPATRESCAVSITIRSTTVFLFAIIVTHVTPQPHCHPNY